MIVERFEDGLLQIEIRAFAKNEGGTGQRIEKMYDFPLLISN